MSPFTSQYRQFIFDAYNFDASTGLLELHYAIDDKLFFTETYKFRTPFVKYDEAALDRAVQSLFFMAGVSYFKTYVPPEIVVQAGELDKAQAEFFSKTYQKGLGEFWFVNQLDPQTPVVFPVTRDESLTTLPASGEGLMVGIGGGKDSLTTVELLHKADAVFPVWWLNHVDQMLPLAKHTDATDVFHVERQWDPQLADLKAQGAFNGHVPISAIFACAGTVNAILHGRRDVVMSNEQSANEASLEVNGVLINHQYSKTQEFERDYQAYLQHCFGDSSRYYSFLRPLSELRIAELFAKVGFEKYKDLFSSCNRAYILESTTMSWCGQCPKCAFTFLILTPFIDRPKLEALWGGKNLLQDPGLEDTYRKLLGIEGDKPLDCVGEIKESRAAMRLAFKQYPELREKYVFELPEDYDFRTLASHEMPPEVYEQFQKATAGL